MESSYTILDNGMRKDEVIVEPDFKTSQPSIASPPIDATADKTEKAWLSSKVQKLQFDIETLKYEDEVRLARTRSIHQQVNTLAKDSGALQRLKDEEIARVTREIEDKYGREYESLNQKQYELRNEKESEVAALNRNVRQITKNQKKMMSYQTLLDLDGDSDTGN